MVTIRPPAEKNYYYFDGALEDGTAEGFGLDNTVDPPRGTRASRRLARDAWSRKRALS